MKINWRIRAKNKLFWLSMVPAVLLIAQIVSGWFGYTLAADFIGEEAVNFINAVFAFLVILGIVVDPTTDGVDDSAQAMRYEAPKRRGLR